jgi:ABC-type transporter Mla subunit MlaD
MGAEYMDSPEAKEVLTDMSGFVGAAEKFATASERFATELGEQGQVVVEKTAEAAAKEGEAVIRQMSEVLSRERAALMEDLSKVLKSQRAALVAEMEAQEGKVRAVLADATATAEAARSMSESVKRAIEAADGLVARLDEPAAPGEESHPFDVREYEAAAAKISEAAREVRRTLETVERPARPPSDAGATEGGDTALSQTVATLEKAMGRTIDRAFYRLLAVAGVAIVGWGVVWAVVRRVGRAR